MNTIPSDFRCGYVAIIGRPNAGKSTLMNALLDIKLSIISSKPQTTRRRTLGILNKPAAQVIFLDTPGVLKPRYRLQEKMMDQVTSAMHDADLLFLIVDAAEKNHPVPIELARLNPSRKPVLLLMNKIDAIKKADLLPLIDLYHQAYKFEAIIPISALAKDGLELLQKEMLERLPLGAPFYPPDLLTDQPERFFAAEIIREKIFEKYYDEIPYSTEVIIEDFKERRKSKDYISATIIVERRSQKGILIGKQGAALKEIGERARRDIEEFLGRPIFLDLRVKVNENWRKDDIKLRRLGF